MLECFKNFKILTRQVVLTIAHHKAVPGWAYGIIDLTYVLKTEKGSQQYKTKNLLIIFLNASYYTVITIQCILCELLDIKRLTFYKNVIKFWCYFILSNWFCLLANSIVIAHKRQIWSQRYTGPDTYTTKLETRQKSEVFSQTNWKLVLAQNIEHLFYVMQKHSKYT